MSIEDTYWSLGLGAMCCPKHHCPMTIYGGCPQCDKEELRIFPKDTDGVEFCNGVWFIRRNRIDTEYIEKQIIKALEKERKENGKEEEKQTKSSSV